MVDSDWGFTVFHYDEDASWAQTNITADVREIPRFTDTSDSQINTAELIVTANRGKYISASGLKIVHGDRIEIQATDGDGGIYTRFFEIIRRIPIKTKGRGTTMRLVMEGIERHFQKIFYAKPHDFTTPKDVVTDIVNSYNDNKGTKLPTVTIGTNELPDKGGPYRYDFALNEDTCWNRLYEVIESMGAAGTSGGVLDFYEAHWTTPTENTLTLNITSSGSTGSSVVVNSDNVNTGEEDGGLDEPEATVLNAWGGTEDGSLPVEFSKFKSRQILLPTVNADDSQFAAWASSQRPYPQGAIVTYNSSVWVSDIDNNNDTPGTNWTLLTPETYYGGTVNALTGSSNIEYSPWTHNKAAHIRNSGADPSATNWSFGGTAQSSMWDINVIVNDDTTFCVDVDLASTTSNVSTFWLYGATVAGLYDGLTVLVNGTGTGDFAGKDNKIMEYNEGAWRVKYEPVTDLLCAVYDKAKTYKYNGSSWVDITTEVGGNWCFHPYESIGQAEGVFLDADTGNEYLGNNIGSAVKVTYKWTPDAAWAEQLRSNLFDLLNVNWATDEDFWKAGAWFNLRFPYPINTYNGITAGAVGDTYGGSLSETIVPSLDTRNMHLTPNGKRGFNKGSDSESLGPLSSLDFFIKLDFYSTATLQAIFQGNFKMRCGLIDSSDHVVYQDFTVSHNQNWQSVKLPLSGFQIYRGRRPRFDSGFIADIFPPKGIPTDEQFEWRHVKGIVIQTQDSYDDAGRYIAGGGNFGITNVQGWTGGVTLDMYIDALRFTKPLLYNTGIVSDKPKGTEFLQKVDIGNYEQLKMETQSELEKKQFPLVQYDVQTTGRFDIDYGDSFFLEDDEIIYIDSTLQSGETTTKAKLVAKYIEYSITKPDNGEGGFLRRIRGVRRFV